MLWIRYKLCVSKCLTFLKDLSSRISEGMRKEWDPGFFHPPTFIDIHALWCHAALRNISTNLLLSHLIFHSGLVACRWFLGVTEAGLFPGVVYYLSCWYKRSEYGIRAAIFFSAATVRRSLYFLQFYTDVENVGVGFWCLRRFDRGWNWIHFERKGIFTCLGKFAFLVKFRNGHVKTYFDFVTILFSRPTSSSLKVLSPLLSVSRPSGFLSISPIRSSSPLDDCSCQ